VRCALLLLLVGLTGCEPVPEGCWDRSETFFRLDAFGSELPVPPDDDVATGSFVAWGPGESIFETTSGEQFGFGLIVEGELTLPDLAELGTVDLQATGFVGDSIEPTSPLLQVYVPGDRTRLLAAIGNRELDADGTRLSLRAPRDSDTCMQYDHENGRARNKPVTAELSSESAVLLQGQSGTLGDLDVHIVTAQSNNRSHPWAPCHDELCPWEKLAWYAVASDR
jgi:hypothetical protein